MAIRGNPIFDVRETNRAIDELLKTTTNRRHRFLLEAYHRHRFLEISGRWPEIFAPDMMAPEPVYNFIVAGYNATLTGQDQVKAFYQAWADSNQSIFYSSNEQVAVADNFVASVVDEYQQTLGQQLIANGIEVDDPNAYYLIHLPGMQMVWPYDDRGRLLGEDVWEPKPKQRTISKLKPEEVITTAMARQLLDPLIRPLPDFDTYLRG